MDVLMLSRIQFALTSTFHYIYPPMSIGLGLMLVIFEGLYIKTKEEKYKEMVRFWSKIFGLTFVLGVATGFVQLLGFGNNWSSYSRFAGDIFGSPLAAEGIFAFFLEGIFLGVMLFGMDRISPNMHYLSTILVSLGAHLSGLWIVIVNSWMQTPAGFAIVGEGATRKAVLTDFWAMALNPSSIDRYFHVILGCWLTGSFMVVSISAYYFLKKHRSFLAKKGLKIGLIVSAVVLILQLVSGDSSAQIVAKYQPAKLAAMEGLYKTKRDTPLTAIGYVDKESQTVKGVKIPGLLSAMVHRNFSGDPVQGLDEIPKEEWPNVPIVFQMFHLMILSWGILCFITLLGALFYWRDSLKKWVLYLLTYSIAFPYIANMTGWCTAEIGRQPWIIQGLLKTADGVSRSINREQVLGSLWMLSIIYVFLLFIFLYLLVREIKKGFHYG